MFHVKRYSFAWIFLFHVKHANTLLYVPRETYKHYYMFHVERFKNGNIFHVKRAFLRIILCELC